MFGPSRQIRQRLKTLEGHLKHENPLLVSAVHSYRQLDQVGYSLGLLGPEESFTMQIPWWPLVSVLGTFSAGKSTFINHYLAYPLQKTGTQAVDDRFTVICYSRDQSAHELPGVALDADPRFPFYQFSEELEKVAEGEGRRVDSYLQLKTCPTEQLRGMILIDSPGFDADDQRTGTLRIIDHIIDLSDLVLVFFDARHPEPGAMRDTLKHLVGDTVSRPDASKFLYVLNQIDVTAREDNPEEVVASWQRALATEGLTAGRFYTTYSPEAAVAIEDDETRRRFEEKRDKDLIEIHRRIHEVGIERAYRIVGTLENTARHIEEEAVPQLRALIGQWERRVLWWDLGFYLLLAAALVGGSVWAGWWQGLKFAPPWWDSFLASRPSQIGAGVALLAVLVALHFVSRRIVASQLLRKLRRSLDPGPWRERLMRAFRHNTRPWRSIFSPEPAGWHWFTRKRLNKVYLDSDRYVQSLNDRFTDPSGETRQ